MTEYVKSFQVLPFSEFSDQKALSFELNINVQILPDRNINVLLSDVSGNFVFNDNAKIKYRET